jgi:acyl dehydratase
MTTIDWFDDLTVGMRFKSDEVQITESDIKRFAAEFDPQPMHLDEVSAAKTLFKGLAASGWHTAAIAMNLAVQIRPFGPHPLIGMGVDGLRWMAPVRPGDVLHLEGEVVGLTPSKTKPQSRWAVALPAGAPSNASSSEAGSMPTHEHLGLQPPPQDNQLMSEHRVLSFKSQLRLGWRGQDGQSETEQPDHSASFGDSITSSTRIRFSVHTGRGRTCSWPC